MRWKIVRKGPGSLPTTSSLRAARVGNSNKLTTLLGALAEWKFKKCVDIQVTPGLYPRGSLGDRLIGFPPTGWSVI